jgi:hypothetical protein
MGELDLLQSSGFGGELDSSQPYSHYSESFGHEQQQVDVLTSFNMLLWFL